MSKNTHSKKEDKNRPSVAPKKKQAVGKKTNPLLYYCIFLFVFSFILYGQSINYGYVLDDDLVSVYDKFVQEGISGIPDIFTKNICPLYTTQGSYRPLLMAHLAIEKEIWGFNPEVSHFFNVFYYAILGVLLFLVLCRLFKDASKVFPLLITMLFLAHPVHTEVVANIKSRDEIFSLIFLLLTILFLFRYLDKGKIILLIASAAFFFLANLSKEGAITYLAVIPLLLYVFTNEKTKRIILLTLPFVFAGAVFFTIRTVVNHGTVTNAYIDPLYNSLLQINSASERKATEIFILGKYIFTLFLPWHLSWDYSYNQIPPVGWLNAYVILSLLVCLCSGAFAFYELKSKRHSVWGFCILYFFITISITSNLIILIGGTMSDRFLFLPSLGFCILIIYAIYKILKIDFSGNSRNNYRLLSGISGGLIFIYLLMTFNREADWKDDLSLYEAGIKDSPNSARTHGALGNEYSFLAQGNAAPNEKAELFKKAEKELKIALGIYPKSYQGWYNLGVVYFGTGRLPEGEEACRNAILYKPDFAQAYNNLGTAQAQSQNFRAAAENFKKAAELDSMYIDAFSNAAEAYYSLGEYKKAAPYYKRCHELQPNAKLYYDRMIENEQYANDTASARKRLPMKVTTNAHYY